ncbi:Two-component transcriptional response regulator, LuxR family [hydrothermal vent metagenome]|uniref:Two-component transcriptional response regulator, LuxR family n=1 Tax=hydrothermal vent metagenome TaxID=652676 RepID=A0A3B0WN32_9ZZZZ
MKILLIDDHELVRDGVKNVLLRMDTSAEVCEATSALSALELANSYKDFDLVLLDMYLPDSTNLDLLCQLRKALLCTPIIVLSASESISDIKKSIELGAKGFIPKSSTNQIIISAIQLVLSGGVYLPSILLEQPLATADINSPPEIQNNKTDEDSFELLNALSKRQLDVLNLLKNGHSNKEIAKTLFLSETTIRVHMTAIFKTLKVSNRTQAALLISQIDLIAS